MAPERSSEPPLSLSELQQSRDRYQLLLEITNAIMSHLTRETLFHAIVESLRRVISFDRAMLPLYDAKRDIFTTFALEGSPLPGHAHHLDSEIGRHGTAAGWVLDQRRPLLKRDLEKEQGLPIERMLLAAGVRSYVTIPLVARVRTVGALFLASRMANQYSQDDTRWLEEVGKQIALAIENMLAYEELDRLKTQREHESLYLQEEIKTRHNFEEIVGQSPAIKQVFQAIETVAPTGATVLILGETGTGKELVARALHNLSPRRDKALVTVNCAALPTGLIESELFGHEKGAFTGAVACRLGRFELADAGTLFLDEIGDLPLELQPKLLRVLQEGAFERVGTSDTITVDVRVIAATNRDLEAAIREGRFRSDLYYRLNVFPIRVPPLRERTADLPLLVRYLALKNGTRLGKRVPSVPPATMAALRAYAWPGNIRELENVIERAMLLSEGAELELRGWLPAGGGREPETGLQTLDAVQRDHILRVLQLTGWRVSGEHGAAHLLGIKATTLEARMKKLGITRA